MLLNRILLLLLLTASLQASSKSFTEWCVQGASNHVQDSLKNVGVVRHDSVIIVHGLEYHSGLQNLELRVYSLSLEPLHKVMVTRPSGAVCVSVIPVQNCWWVIYAAPPTLGTSSMYGGSSSDMQQSSYVYFTNVFKPIPGEITGVVVLDSGFNRIINEVVQDPYTLKSLNESLKLNSDLGTHNYPMFTGHNLIWNVAKEIYCAGVDDARSGVLVKKWEYVLTIPAVGTMNLLGVIDSTVLITYSTYQPAQPMIMALSLNNGSRLLERSLSDSTGTIFPSRVVATETGFLMAGGYVQKFVGPYPLTFAETSSGETRYYGRIDGTFIAEYGHDFVLKKSVRTPLPADIAEKPEDKFTIKACRFALCAELCKLPSGIIAVFEIVSTKPPFEAKKFNKRAPQRMEQYYLPHSYVCGLVAMRTNPALTSATVASSIWDHAADFVIDRNAWDFFSTIYPGPQSNCFRSIRSNPHRATEANRETHDGYFLPQNGEAEFYNTHARQAFEGSDNNPYDIQSIFATDSTLLFDFTIQDTLNAASIYTPVFSYRFSATGEQATISSSGSRKILYRFNDREVITFTGNDAGNKYILRRETL